MGRKVDLIMTNGMWRGEGLGIRDWGLGTGDQERPETGMGKRLFRFVPTMYNIQILHCAQDDKPPHVILNEVKDLCKSERATRQSSQSALPFPPNP